MNTTDNNVKYDESWLRRYRTGKLSGEELEQFEIYLLDHPDLVEEVELELMLQETLPELELAEMPARQVSNDGHFKTLALSNIATAALCALLFLGWHWVQTDSQPKLLDSRVIYVESYRDSLSDAGVEKIDVSNLNSAMIVFSDLVSEEDYKVSLQRNGQALPELQINLKSNIDGEISLFLPLQDYEQGVYSLSVMTPANEQVFKEVSLSI